MVAAPCNCPSCLLQLIPPVAPNPPDSPAFPSGRRFVAVFQCLPEHGAGAESVELYAEDLQAAGEAAGLLHRQRDGRYASKWVLVELERGGRMACQREWVYAGELLWQQVELG